MVSSASSSLILFSFISNWERRMLACSVASLLCLLRSHFSLSSMSFSFARAFTASSLSCTAHKDVVNSSKSHFEWLVELHVCVKDATVTFCITVDFFLFNSKLNLVVDCCRKMDFKNIFWLRQMLMSVFGSWLWFINWYSCFLHHRKYFTSCLAFTHSMHWNTVQHS